MKNLDELIENRRGTTVQGRHGGGFLDDLIRNTREGLPVSPQDAARHKKRISADKFFAAAQELQTEGTYKGQPIPAEHRKEGFKIAKKGDKIGFQQFMDSVLERKANPPIDFEGGGSSNIKPKKQKLLTGTTFAPPKDEQKKLEAHEPVWVKFLKDIGKRLENVVNILKGKAANAEDAADEKGQEAEKAKRIKKEKKKEAGAKKLGIPGPIKAALKPVTSLWDTIVQMLGAIIIGWGVTKLLTWLQDPKNAKAVEQFKDFVVTFLPPILKGLLALAAFNIATKLFLFTKSIITGAAGMIKALWGFSSKIFLWAAANPWLAVGIGLAALVAGAAILGSKGKEESGGDLQGELESDEGLSGDEVQQAGDAAVAAQTTKGGGVVQQYKDGGLIKEQVAKLDAFSGGGLARGTDTVPAMLTPGEYVMSKNAVSMYGGGLFEGMNKAAGSVSKTKRGGGGVTYAAEGGSIGTSTGEKVTGAGVDTQLIAAQPGEFVMSKGAVEKYGVDTMEGMNAAGGGTNKPKKATVKSARGGGSIINNTDSMIHNTFNRGGLINTFSGGGIVGGDDGGEKKKKGGLIGKIEGLVNKLMDAGAAKGAALGFMTFGPPGALVGGGIGALGNVIDARINGAAGQSAEQLMNNPPTPSNEDRQAGSAIGGAQAPGEGGPSGSDGSDDGGPPPMFSALDERNLSTLITKSMYSVVN